MITNCRTRKDEGGGDTVEVVDNLLDDSPTKALASNQGVVLKGLTDNNKKRIEALESGGSGVEVGTSTLMMNNTKVRGYRSLSEGDLSLPMGAYPDLEIVSNVKKIKTSGSSAVDTGDLEVSADYSYRKAGSDEGVTKIGKWLIYSHYDSGTRQQMLGISSEDGSDTGFVSLKGLHQSCSDKIGDQIICTYENKIIYFDYLSKYRDPIILRVFEVDASLDTAQKVADSAAFLFEDANAISSVYGVSNPFAHGYQRDWILLDDIVVFPPSYYYNAAINGFAGVFNIKALSEQGNTTKGFAVDLKTHSTKIDFTVSLSLSNYMAACDNVGNFAFVCEQSNHNDILFINLFSEVSKIVTHPTTIDAGYTFACYSRDGNDYVILNSPTNNRKIAYNIKDGSVAYDDTSAGLVQYLYDDGKEYVAIGRNVTDSRRQVFTDHFKNGKSGIDPVSTQTWKNWYSIIKANNTGLTLVDTYDLAVQTTLASAKNAWFASKHQRQFRNRPFFYYHANFGNLIRTTFYGIEEAPQKELIIEGIPSTHSDKKWFIFTGESEIDPSTGLYIDPNY